jgi:hypothetical protein
MRIRKIVGGLGLVVVAKAAWLSEHPRGPSTTRICMPRKRAMSARLEAGGQSFG